MSNLSAMILAEVLFLLLIASLVWLLVTRKRAQGLRRTLTLHKRQNASLKARLKAVKANYRKKLADAETALNALKQNPYPDLSRELRSYKQRVENLEKFKALYFELEERLSANTTEDDADELAKLRDLVENQSQLIDDLKTNLEHISSQYQLETELAKQLSFTVGGLETSNASLTEQLGHATRQRRMAEKDAAELTIYKEQAAKLEANESRLRLELSDYRKKLENLTQRGSDDPDYGKVQLREIRDLSGKLDQREQEIRRLRSECETVAQQYEELAVRSLSLVGENNELSQEQKDQLEALKRQLENNAAELARKQAECEMLENYYLELEANASLDAAAGDLNNSLAEKAALEEQRQELHVRLEDACDEATAADLSVLRESLAEQQAALETTRRDYQELMEQFVQVAQEDENLRQLNTRLQEECNALREEVHTLREAVSKAPQEELESLRTDYSKMESRYLDLLDKYHQVKGKPQMW